MDILNVVIPLEICGTKILKHDTLNVQLEYDETKTELVMAALSGMSDVGELFKYERLGLWRLK